MVRGKFLPSVLLLIALASCSSTSPANDATEEQLLGTWRSEKGSILTLNADRSFVSDRFPSSAFMDAPTEETAHVAGTWRLTKDYPAIENLVIEMAVGKSYFPAEVRSKRSAIVLRIAYGDSDPLYMTFHR